MNKKIHTAQPMETIFAQTLLLRYFRVYGIAMNVLWDTVVKCRIEECDRFGIRQDLDACLDNL